MADGALTREEIEAWLRPIEARRLVTEVFGDAKAATNIIERLRGGSVQAIAAEFSVSREHQSLQSGAYIRVLPADWEAWKTTDSASDLWGVGDIRVFVSENPSRSSIGFRAHAINRYRGIKFEPSGVYAMLPGGKPTEPLLPAPNLSAAAPAAPNQSMPKLAAVSPTHLREWFGLYQRVYSGDSLPISHAEASARGMFPDKFVSRDRIRALLPERKRGPKGGKT